MNNEIYACVHVAEFPAQAMLRLRPELRDRSVAVIKGEAPFERVCAVSESAAHMGIEAGMMRAEFEMYAGIVLLRRSAEEEQSAKQALLECATMFSPRVEDQSRERVCTLIADVAGTERLLGRPEQVVNDMLAHIAALGMAATVVVSWNFHTAMCAARAGKSLVIQAGRESHGLSALPLAVAEPSAEHAELLEHWGIRTLGQLAALPEVGLITRLGQEGRRLRQLARGACPHLFEPVKASFRLLESIAFEAPVEILDSLLFAINPLLEQLMLRARARSLALAAVTVKLRLEGGGEHERTVRPALASEDKALLLKLLHLDLAAHPPSAAVSGIELNAEAGRTSKVQLGLFTPQLPEASRLDVTLARIRALVGEENVGSPALEDTHKPGAWHNEPFTVTRHGGERSPAPRVRTALRRLHPAENAGVRVKEAQPYAIEFRSVRYTVDRAYGPWLMNGAWWGGAAWSLEQWDVLAHGEASGAMLCCCLTRDLATSLWHVEALYD